MLLRSRKKGKLTKKKKKKIPYTLTSIPFKKKKIPYAPPISLKKKIPYPPLIPLKKIINK